MRTVVLHQCSSSPPRFILTASTIGPRTEALDGGLSCACRSVADFLEHVGPQLRRVALECRELPRQDARMGRLGRQPPASAAVGRAVYFFCGRVQSLDLGCLEIPHCPPSCDAVPEVIMHPADTANQMWAGAGKLCVCAGQLFQRLLSPAELQSWWACSA